MPNLDMFTEFLVIVIILAYMCDFVPASCVVHRLAILSFLLNISCLIFLIYPHHACILRLPLKERYHFTKTIKFVA